ncbi:hypothetical protein D9M68_589570 [compost metagenome]
MGWRHRREGRALCCDRVNGAHGAPYKSLAPATDQRPHLPPRTRVHCAAVFFRTGPRHELRAPRQRPRHRLRHLQLHRRLVAAGRRAADRPGRRQAHPALGGVLQQRGAPAGVRPPGPARIPGRLRRAVDALTEEPARLQPAEERDHRAGQRAAVQGAAAPVHRPAQAARRGGGRAQVRAGGAGPSGVLRRRRPASRPRGPGHPGRSGEEARFQGRVVPVRTDRRGLRLRAWHRPRGAGADRRHRRRHLGLLAGAPGAGAPRDR